MNVKRIFALLLSLCLLMPYALCGRVSAEEAAEEIPVSEEIAFEQVDKSEVDVDLTGEMSPVDDLVLVQEMTDENGMIPVFIVMEGKSVIEGNPMAVLNADTQAQMEALEKDQERIVQRIEDAVLDGGELEISYSYTWLFNGVAAEIPVEAMAEIAAMDGVEQVIVQPVYEIFETTVSDAEQMTISDGVMIGRESTWADGYTGQGIKIAVIDTGLDIDHQNFQPLGEDKLTADSATADSVAAVLGSLNASMRYPGLTIGDVYHSTKVVFGFNYSDDNIDITHDNDGQGDHGTHVAGIAAANKVAESGVVGVAPDAQLFIMKVFGYERAGYGSDIIAALEDALILGVDVVNMSLGSNAGFTSSANEFIDSIYARVADTNTVLCVSAGNNYTAGYGNSWGTNANTTLNPDNAVIGEPGVYTNVLSVASVENVAIERNYIQVSDGYKMAFTETSASYGLPSVLDLDGEFALVAVPGYGEEADFEGLDVTGKVALIQRGGINFALKCENAAANGAAVCIVYNNVSGEFGMDLTDCTAGIPCISITMADGTYLVSALETDSDLTISFPDDVTTIPNENAYNMSDFSSWGVAPDLSLEPDITAPGGNIYSTINGGEYGLMSGTSMAAPNTAGISALVMQYVKENFDASTDYRTMVQNLLVSTSSPLTYGEDGLYYSPRSQGSGLANAFDAVSTKAYLTVDGSDVPKAELGDDPGKSGAYSYTFKVTNFGGSDAYYDLDTVVQTEGYTTNEAYEGVYFMSSTPVALGASAYESSASLVLTHDVDGNQVTDSHDAYYIYRASQGTPEDAAWADTSFRYDLNGDDAVAADDVQAYLNALVGLDSDGDLEDTVLCVEAGKSAQVTVSVSLSDSGRSYLDTYYPNGGYVEGFTLLRARSTGSVDLSLPYLGFYGSWDEAPIIDDGDYWDMLNAEEGEVVGNQYVNVLFTNFYGYTSYVYPGYNVYVEEAFDPAHIAVSPNNDGYFDTVDDIYTSLLRNAGEITYRYTNMDTGEVYYEQSALHVSKSVYTTSYSQIIPACYSWFEGEFPFYDWKQPNGEDLANNTTLLLEIEATGAYDGATADSWSVPIYVDVEAPELQNVVKTTNEDGTISLTLTFRDNHYVSAASLMNSNSSEIYYLEGVEDPEPDENGYRNYSVTCDITDITGKLLIVLSDYALNETYYALNVAGEGSPYGELVAYQYNFDSELYGWVAFGEGVENNEVQITMDDMNFACAEYVNGFVFAQTESGELYGFRYEDMLKDTFELELNYITRMDYVYQDMAYNYADGKLYGLHVYEDAGYAYSSIYSINIQGAYTDESTGEAVGLYDEVWAYQRGGLYGLGLACDDNGTFYIIGTSEDQTQLWASYEHASYGTLFRKIMNIDVPMDYLQSMTWDHNTEKLYWAQFYAYSFLEQEAGLYCIDVDAKTCTKAGTLSGETCAMFAPLSEDTAAMEAHANVPVMDTSIVATPVLRDNTVTMNVGGVENLVYDLDPWYSDHRNVVWSSNDESVATVDQNGTVTAVGTGSAVITVANTADASCYTTCAVEVTALDLAFEGIVTAQTAGVGGTGGTSTYRFQMEDGVASFGTVSEITAPEDLNFGLSIATSVYGRGSIWACEYGNTGMIYEIDPATGVVVDAIHPIDGDMIFGLTYNESLDTFTGIMNMYLYVDLELTHEETEKVMGSYDEERREFTYHKLNLLPYLLESDTGFITNETGQGASSEVVMCGITTLAESYTYVDTYQDYMGNIDSNPVNYTSTQTLVVLDNVGRLWYIDEIVGMTKSGSTYTDANGSNISADRNGVVALECEDGTYNVFYIRQIDETPLTEMFRQGSLPRITYHFSDIEYAGKTENGAPMFALSLYDYWNNGTTNELYLYVTAVTEFNQDTYETVTIHEDKLYDVGDTGQYNIIASIHNAEVTGGVEEESGEEAAPETVNPLFVGVFPGKADQTE